jgi:hypothetical protein
MQNGEVSVKIHQDETITTQDVASGDLSLLIVQVREENARLKKENRDLKQLVPFTYAIGHNSSTKTITERSSYHLHLKAERLAVEVDPRDTLAAYLVSKNFSEALFVFTKQTLKCQVGLLVAGNICILVSVLFNPIFGYGSAVQLPFIILSILLFNRSIVSALIRTFEWWAMLSLLLIFLGSVLDAVKFDPPRVVAAFIFAAGFIYILCFDARPFVKRRRPIDLIFWLFLASNTWAGLILWWCGKWIDVRETVIPIDGTISINVQSIGFSCYCTLAVLVTKYAVVINRSTEANQCIILKTPVAYRYYDRCSAEHHQPV